MAVALASDFAAEVAAYKPTELDAAADALAGLLAVIPMTAFANASTQQAITAARSWLAKNGHAYINERHAAVEAWVAAHPAPPKDE